MVTPEGKENIGFVPKNPQEGIGADGLPHAPTTDEFRIPTYSDEIDAARAAEYGAKPSSGVLGQSEQAAPEAAADKAREAGQQKGFDNATLPNSWESAERDQLTGPVAPEAPAEPTEKAIGDSDRKGYPPVIH
jgi:hypothetical protein